MFDRPLFIGLKNHDCRADDTEYLSDYNFSERKRIIWDPNSLVSEFLELGVVVQGALNSNHKTLVLEKLMDRQRALHEFLAQSGDLIIILRDLHFQGGSLNELTFTSSFLPQQSTGTSITVDGIGELSNLLSQMNDDLMYTAVAQSEEISPLFSIPNSNQVVGGFLESGFGGYHICLPMPRLWNGQQPENVSARTKFLNCALMLPDLIRESIGATANLPSWAEDYRLPNEHTARNHIIELDEVIARSHTEIAMELETISIQEARKHLFTGFDDGLEDAVRDVFHSLGIQVIKGVPNQVDALARIGDTILAIEIKGLKTPCKRKNITQCKGWVGHCESVLEVDPSDFDDNEKAYAEKLREIGVPIPVTDDDPKCGMKVKGVLIINAHRHKTLAERDDPSEPAFNDDNRAALRRDKYCAMTGIQLLGMSIAAERDSAIAERLAQSIIDTVGVHPEFNDWTHFLEQPTPG